MNRWQNRLLRFNIAVLSLVLSTILDVTRHVVPIENAVLDLSLAIASLIVFVPGILYFFLFWIRVDSRWYRIPRREKLIMRLGLGIGSLIWVGPSLHRMLLAAYGIEFPFYQLLLSTAWIIFIAGVSVTALGCFFLRLQGPLSIYEVPHADEMPGLWRRSLGGKFQGIGLVASFAGVYLGYFFIIGRAIATLAFVLLVSGLFLFPIGRLMEKYRFGAGPIAAAPVPRYPLTLARAKPASDAYVVMEGGWGAIRYLVCPASLVRCEEKTLRSLLGELAVLYNLDPNGASLYFVRLSHGEELRPVTTSEERGKALPDLWVPRWMVEYGLSKRILKVLRGELPTLTLSTEESHRIRASRRVGLGPT